MPRRPGDSGAGNEPAQRLRNGTVTATTSRTPMHNRRQGQRQLAQRNPRACVTGTYGLQPGRAHLWPTGHNGCGQRVAVNGVRVCGAGSESLSVVRMCQGVWRVAGCRLRAVRIRARVCGVLMCSVAANRRQGQGQGQGQRGTDGPMRVCGVSAVGAGRSVGGINQRSHGHRVRNGSRGRNQRPCGSV